MSAAALAPLGRPLRIHQPELVAGQKLVRFPEQNYGANLSPSTLKVLPTERLPRKGWNKSLAAVSNTSYNLISVTYEKQNFQPGMDPLDPSVAAPPDQPARPHLAQAAEARRRGDQEFGLRPALQREDARRFPVAQTGDRVVERRGDRLSRRRG